MKEPTARKAGAQKRGTKKYPKILAVPSTADEIQAVYQFTPAEIRYAKRILARVERKSARASK
jgi:hypothetical protein